MAYSSMTSNRKAAIVVAGGSGGMGLAIAGALVAAGRDVILVGRNKAKLDAARADLAARDPAVTVERAVIDVAEPPSVEAGIAEIAARHPVMGGYVHAAGGGTVAPLAETSDAAWFEAYTVKVVGAVRMLRGLLPRMTAADASIVLIGGVFAREPHPLFPVNSAINAATQGLGKALARDLAPRGIRVNVLHPGATDTPLWHNLAAAVGRRLGVAGASVTESACATLMGGTLLSPDDVAEAVAFLMSPAARRITGSSVVLDAGETRAA